MHSIYLTMRRISRLAAVLFWLKASFGLWKKCWLNKLWQFSILFFFFTSRVFILLLNFHSKDFLPPLRLNKTNFSSFLRYTSSFYGQIRVWNKKSKYEGWTYFQFSSLIVHEQLSSSYFHCRWEMMQNFFNYLF